MPAKAGVPSLRVTGTRNMGDYAVSHRDQFGVALTSGDAAAVRQFDTAVAKLLTFNNDPVAEVDRATASDPGLVMGHVLKGLLCVLGTEKSLLPDAREALAAGKQVAAGALVREHKHLQALEAWIDGRLNDACAMWESVLVDQPDDALAMIAAHQGDFFLGQSSELRDRVARRLPDIDKGSKLEGYYQGMHAFGLEEMGDYARAEEAGARALASDRRDAWAVHAVAHVLEMTNRIADGQRFLSTRKDDWSSENFFAVHNWWHLALYYFDEQRWDEVLELYDTRIRGGNSTVILDMIDASALLWRLKLHGVDVGNRWQELARAWEPRIEDAWYSFNDMHAMMAFAASGRGDLAQGLLAVMQRSAEQPTDNGAMTRAVGLPVAKAVLAYADGRYSEATDLLKPVKAIAARAGGSHAQRDLLAQTLTSAAEKSGRTRLARSLLNERLALKPGSGLNRAWMQRVSRTAGAAGG
jgi:tetratricopeptide (TPR) repeat protein